MNRKTTTMLSAANPGNGGAKAQEITKKNTIYLIGHVRATAGIRVK